jgi:hypothetical protein
VTEQPTPTIRRMYRVTITTPDGTPVFVGEVGDDDRIAFVQEAGKSSRVELTATEAIEALSVNGVS